MILLHNVRVPRTAHQTCGLKILTHLKPLVKVRTTKILYKL